MVLLLGLLGASTLGCTDEGSAARQALELITPPRPRPEATGTVVSGRSQRAQYFLDIGKLELQLGATEAAISAFEAALQLDPANQEAKVALEQARQAAAQATPLSAPRAVATPLPFVVPALSLATPSPTPTITPTATPPNCLGDEKMTFDPPVAAVGDRVVVSVTSAREHLNVRLAAPGPAEVVAMTQTPSGYLWRWNTTAAAKGDFSYFYYMDVNTLCAAGKLSVTGRWQPLSSNLPNPDDFRITAIGVSPYFPLDKTLYVAFDGKGVFKSVDADAASPTFSAVTTGLTDMRVLSLALSPNYGRDATLFAGTKGGLVFRSMDGGNSWVPRSLPLGTSGEVTALALSPTFASDGTLFAGIDVGGVFMSADKGDTWSPTNEGLTDRSVRALAISADYANDGTVFAGGRFSGSYRLGTATPTAAQTPAATATPITGQTPVATATPIAAQPLPSPLLIKKWSPINVGLEDLWIQALAISPYYANDLTLFAASAYGGLFKHDGKEWKKVNDPWAEKWVWAHSVALSPRFPREPVVYVGTRTGIYRTTNGGDNWVLMNAGLPDIALIPDVDRGVRALAISPDFGNDRTVFAGVWRNNIYRARD